MSVDDKKSATALEIIVKTLDISESQRGDLLESLRKLKLLDDNDPLVKMTLTIGLMTKLISEIPARLLEERQASILEFKKSASKCVDGLAETAEFLKKLEGMWMNSVEFWETKQRGAKQEFGNFMRELADYHIKLQALLVKAEKIESDLSSISIGNICTSALTTLAIISFFRWMGWL